MSTRSDSLSFFKLLIYVGIAFHHAGLTSEERNNVELGFRSGALKVRVSEIDKCERRRKSSQPW